MFYAVIRLQGDMAYNFTQYHDAARSYAAHLRTTLPYHAPHAHRGITEKSLKSAVPSSTPHAPRNLVNQHGQPVPQKRHLKQYKLLGNTAYKSASAPNLLANKDEKQVDNVDSFPTNHKQQVTKPSKVCICAINLSFSTEYEIRTEKCSDTCQDKTEFVLTLPEICTITLDFCLDIIICIYVR